MNRPSGAGPAQSEAAPLRVMIVNHHAGTRRRLQNALQARLELAIVGDARTAADAVEQAARLHPDVVVLDLDLPDGSGVDACHAILRARPETRVLMLTSRPEQDALLAAMIAGASGYLARNVGPKRIQEAVITVGNGGSLLDPHMATTVLQRLREGTAEHPAEEAFADLSPQEDRILQMIADGQTNSEIAAALSLSEKTIKNYVSSIYAKLNVERRSQAARLATERRLRQP